MQKTMLMAALSATLAMAAATVQAQDPMPPKPAPPPPATPAPPAAPMSWSALDANSNGTLDAGEAARMESLAKVFPAADADAIDRGWQLVQRGVWLWLLILCIGGQFYA